MQSTSDEELLTSRKHVENARAFMLVLALLVVIAAIHLIWTCLSINSAAQSLADEQEGVSLLQYEQLTLRGYLLSGNTRDLAGIAVSQRALRELAGRKPAFNFLVDLEDNWYVNFAEPLIRQRKHVDAGDNTVAEMEVLYLQLYPAQERISAFPTVAGERGGSLNRKVISDMVRVRVTIGILIAVGAMLVALFGLRSVTALEKTA